MPRNNEISTELEQLSMVVAGISRQSPYEAPSGYFSEFPEKMLALASRDAMKEAPSPEWGKGPVMSVPEGYFEGFASRMMDKIRQSGQSGQSGANQEVPVLGESSPLLDRIGKNMPYQVPEGYFETSIPSVVLLGLKDKSAFEVPEGYFETLTEIVLARVQTSEAVSAPPEAVPARGKVVSMSSSRRSSWWKYAAAAVVAGFFVSFGWQRVQTLFSKGDPVVANVNVPQDLTKVSDQDIQNYVDDHTAQLQQVQQEEDYANSTASLDISDNDVKSLLGDVPDGDLAQYMEEHGDLKDYPTN
jgi:hypothetical protein